MYILENQQEGTSNTSISSLHKLLFFLKEGNFTFPKLIYSPKRKERGLYPNVF